MTVQRFDLGGYRSKPKQLPNGYWRMTGNLTRTGVLKYRKADGTIIRELRHPDDVFDEASMLSLEDVPVTDMHPEKMLTNRTRKSFSAGHVRKVEPQGKFLTGEIVVQDEDLCELVKTGARRELSPGYECNLEMVSGTYEGEAYDARQRNIVYNHLAVGPQGWGRSGPEVAVHMDSAACEIGLYEELEMDPKTKKKTDSAKPDTDESETAENETLPLKQPVKTEDEKHPVKGEPAPAAIPTQPAEVKKDGGVAEKLVEVLAENEKLKAKFDSVSEFLKPEHFAKAVAARVAFESQARRVLGTEAKLDGKSENEIRVEALKARGVSVEGKSEAYVEARFDALLETSGLHSLGVARADSSAPAKPAPDAREALIAKQNRR